MLRPRATTSSTLGRSTLTGLALAGVLLAVLMSLGVEARADGVDDARRKVSQMADQLEAAEEEVDRLSEDLRAAEDDKVRLDGEILAAEAEIAAKEAELGGLRTDMSEVAITAFVSGGRTGTISGLLSPGSGPNESVQRQVLTDMALNTGLSNTDELDALISDLDDLKGKLEKSRQRTEELAQRISKSRTEAEDKIAKYTALKARAERELGSALRAERERRAAQAAASAASQADSLRNDRDPQRFDPSSIPSTTSRAGVAVAAARSQIGVRYRYAAAEEGVAFDCSGLTMWAWRQAGVSLPHQSRRQFNASPRIPKEYAEPGDLIFFYSPITHVGLYVGGGMMVDAPGVGRTVRLTPVSWNKVVGVTRPG